MAHCEREDCIHKKICYEVNTLPCRKDFVWYSGEGGCPHYKSTAEVQKAYDNKLRTELTGLICDAIRIINDPAYTPIEDVVDVVRCKDCKHLRTVNCVDVYAMCEKTRYVFLPFQTDTRTHFCSFGERR